MGKKNKNKRNISIPDPIPPKEKRIKFSFRFYDISQNNYCISKWEQDKIAKALGRLQEISDKTYSELYRDKSTYHFHSVDWSQTRKDGFPSNGANSLEPFQFTLLGVNGQKARVYGALSQNTFYIVWFDVDHKICPTLKKHT